MTTTTAPRRQILPRAKADTWQLVFGTVYLVMATNIMLAVASLPLLVLLVTTDPSASWPVLALAAVAAAPGLSAACAVFAGFTTQRSTDVVRTFARAWLTHLRRSLAIGGLAVAVATVLVVDLVWAAGTRLGPCSRRCWSCCSSSPWPRSRSRSWPGSSGPTPGCATC
ncbi:hypothetical protein C8046_08380 [Serinibacter arcticus]|uniref:Uncharacterized protein n=1 Tax=Serinibacter arcticus TaxID=1655435 RepID=A0A2U1ZUM2_9MICO|nr:DUF624 domain-containing protein [Serinibacter arcticus]PWD50669.1 hypothetical protein C8046_08380 [Serinibacter arcticus]